MHESDRLFTDLQPPSGGLQRLQRTLDSRHDNRRFPRWRFVAGAFAAFVLALASLLSDAIVRHRQTAELVSAMRAAIAPSANGIRVVDGAAIELPSGQNNVRLYLVQSNTTDPSKQTGGR